MSTVLNFLKGTPIIFLGNVVASGLVFITRLTAANLLTPNQYGILVLGVTVLNLSALFFQLGQTKGLAREIPRNDHIPALYLSSIFVTFALGLVCILTILYFDHTFSIISNQYNDVILIFMSFGLFHAKFNLSISTLRGLSITESKVALQLLNRSLIIILVISGIRWSAEQGAILGWCVAVLLSMCVSIYYTSKLLDLSFEDLNIDTIRTESPQLLKFSIPLLLATASWRLMRELDNLFLVGLSSVSDLGVYDVAFTLSIGLLLFLRSFGYLFLPQMSEYHNQSKIESVRELYSQTTKILVILTMPVYAFTVLYSKSLLTILVGPDYSDGYLVLIILMTAFFTHVLVGLNKEMLTAMGKTRFIFATMFIFLMLNVILNIYLIPKFKITGAAVATATSYIGVNIVMSLWLYIKSKINPASDFPWKTIILSAIMYSIIWYYVEFSSIILAFFVGTTFFIITLSASVIVGDISLKRIKNMPI